jgi:hypothetical protein
MNEQNGFRKTARSISLAVVSMVCIACPQEHSKAAPGASEEKNEGRAFNLARLSCPGNPIDIKIEVKATPDVLADDNNLVVFGCEGDKIRWYTNDLTLKVTVALEGEKAGDLFKGGPTLFVSGADGKTAVGTVEKPKKHVYVHKYSIWVTPPGQEPFHVDPHVIPMGK